MFPFSNASGQRLISELFVFLGKSTHFTRTVFVLAPIFPVFPFQGDIVIGLVNKRTLYFRVSGILVTVRSSTKSLQAAITLTFDSEEISWLGHGFC